MPDEPYLITPPPGMLPERRRDDDPTDAEAPVQTGSGTRRLELPRQPPTTGVPLPDAAAAAAPAPVASPSIAAPAAPVAPETPPAPDEALSSTVTRTGPAEAPADVDDATVLRADVVAVESAPDHTVPVSSNLERRWVVEFSDGTRVTIAPGGLIVGRDPIGFPRWPQAELVRLDDPTRSVSKTHAVIQPDADGVRVIDLGSTNGVNRIVDDLRVPVDADQGALVRDGAVLEFGSLIGTVRHV